MLFACSALGAEQDIGGPSAFAVIGGAIIPEEGSPTEGGFGFEGEDIVSPGPTIVVKAGQPVTITFENVHEGFPVEHNFVIVAEKDKYADRADPLWGAETERLREAEEQTITFTPDTPGSYLYICSVSDHAFLGMWGIFVVEE
jgi:plastocyanin